MSLHTTLRTMRKNEIMADLGKMTVTDLMARRTELRSILRTNPSESQLSKQDLSDITMSISRELTSRAEAQDIKDGNDPKAKAQAILKGAKELREVDNNRIAAQKLQRARTDFDESSDKIGFSEEHGNPYSKEASDFL